MDCCLETKVALFLLVTCLFHTSGGERSSQVLRLVSQNFWSWKIRQFPTIATFFNIPNMDDKLEDLSLRAADERQAHAEFLWQHLQRVNASELGEEDRLTYDILSSDLQHLMEGYKYRMYGYINPINFLQGFHKRKAWTGYPLRSVPDYHNFLRRLQGVATQVDQAIAVMRESIRLKRTNHNVSMRGIPEYLEEEILVPDNETLYFKPFLQQPEAFMPTDKWLRIVERALYLITNVIKPALRRLREFIVKSYLPATRVGYGVGTLDGGSEYYQACLRFHLTDNVTAAEIRDLGLQEVSRIKTKMYDIIRRQGFNYSLSEFFTYLRQYQTLEYYNRTEDELLSGYRHIIHDVITPKLPTVLNHMPQAELQILPVRTDGPSGTYSSGVFYVNLQRAHTRPTFTMTALALHEALPGHHLQVEYTRQQRLPNFRRHLCCMKYNTVPLSFQWYSAYTEGWGLYAEYLGELMGVYNSSSLELFGRYSSEILRACRLVVDTGIHVYGWSREAAISYLEEHTPIPHAQIEVEIDRYISWPGQACAYKYGEVTIQRLREEATRDLGADFNLQEFNEQILKTGRVPLDVLTEVIRRWIRRSKITLKVKVSHMKSEARKEGVNYTVLLTIIPTALCQIAIRTGRYWSL